MLALQEKRAFCYTLPPMLLAHSERVNTFPQQFNFNGRAAIASLCLRLYVRGPGFCPRCGQSYLTRHNPDEARRRVKAEAKRAQGVATEQDGRARTGDL